MADYHKLYTAEDTAVFIDHQPQMTFGVANIDRSTLINNVTLLAKVAKGDIPAVLTAVETESFRVIFGHSFLTFLKVKKSSVQHELMG